MEFMWELNEIKHSKHFTSCLTHSKMLHSPRVGTGAGRTPTKWLQNAARIWLGLDDTKNSLV